MNSRRGNRECSPSGKILPAPPLFVSQHQYAENISHVGDNGTIFFGLLSDDLVAFIFGYLQQPDICAARLSCHRFYDIIDATTKLLPSVFVMNPPREGQSLGDRLDVLWSLLRDKKKHNNITAINATSAYHCLAMHQRMRRSRTERHFLANPRMGWEAQPIFKYPSGCKDDCTLPVVQQYSKCDTCLGFTRVSKIRANLCIFF